ncbi:hypothetical protein BaRGS_00001327 [Batillaria attramentaria]|uniref:Uncharacterized protein n=1 Tax=Batillaria attramentaria TaxID=370345 RepID=A0ABD0M6V6_9CAEN
MESFYRVDTNLRLGEEFAKYVLPLCFGSMEHVYLDRYYRGEERFTAAVFCKQKNTQLSISLHQAGTVSPSSRGNTISVENFTHQGMGVLLPFVSTNSSTLLQSEQYQRSPRFHEVVKKRQGVGFDVISKIYSLHFGNEGGK